MLTTVAFGVVALLGLFFVALAGAALLRPAVASSFLLGFAATARTHYLELGIRLVAGAALVIAAGSMPFPMPILVFGWVLILTALVLATMPWRWHQSFAKRSVPKALGYLPFIGICSLAAGVAILASAIAASGD